MHMPTQLQWVKHNKIKIYNKIKQKTLVNNPDFIRAIKNCPLPESIIH